MAIWHYCKLVQKWGSGGDTASNDHTEDFIYLDNGQLTYKDAPLPQPLTSTVFSYEIYCYLEGIRKPRVPITGFKFWSITSQPDAPKNKIYIYIGATSVYDTPVNTLSTKAITRQDTNYYDSANSLAITGTISAIGDKSKYLVLQLRIASSAGKIQLNLPMHFKFNTGGG